MCVSDVVASIHGVYNECAKLAAVCLPKPDITDIIFCNLSCVVLFLEIFLDDIIWSDMPKIFQFYYLSFKLTLIFYFVQLLLICLFSFLSLLP